MDSSNNTYRVYTVSTRMSDVQRAISVAVVSGTVAKTPKAIHYAFVFDEASKLADSRLNVHIIRSKAEDDSFSYGIYFHGLKKRIDPRAFRTMFEEWLRFPQFYLLRKPKSIYWEYWINRLSSNVTDVIRNNCIDLIHAHFAYPEGAVGLQAKKRTGKPLVVTVHGYDIQVESAIRYGVRLDKKINKTIIEVLNEADAVIAASRDTFNEVNKIVRNADKVHLIPNGVDLKRFNPNVNGSHLRKKLGVEGRTIVFSLRHHEPEYGLEYLIRAIPIVAKEKEDVVFVIGGDGSLMKFHQQLANDLGIRDKVVFVVSIPRDEVPYYYAMSNLTVVPSIQEAFGLVVSEAMACGKPTIGTNVGGIPDQIIDGYNGFLVQTRNHREIAEKILLLLNDPERARQMGVNGRKIVQDKFDANKRTAKIIQLYLSLLKGRSAK
jgi:glycosyltransferase involved in cell wall biosynthesis